MSRTTYTTIERLIIGLMMVGLAGMFQPFAIGLYRYGFLVLLFSTLAFIIWSHLSPREERDVDTGPVSLHDAVEAAQGHEGAQL
jgi:hypothetical protein